MLKEIADDNPFKQIIANLRENGDSWHSIWNQLEDAYNPVDSATFEESCMILPE